MNFSCSVLVEATRLTVYGVNIPVGGWSVLPNPSLHAQFIHIAGCTEVRTELGWSDVQPDPNTWDWSSFDQVVTVAAQNSLTVLPILWKTPKWASSNPEHKDPRGNPDYFKFPPTAQGPWGTFCKEAVNRYKAGGQFWIENPSLTPQRPITVYEIWNEPNNLGQNWIPRGSEVQSVSDYIALYNTARTSIHAAAPYAGVQVMVGGLAAEPGYAGWGWEFTYYLQLLKDYGIDITYGPPDAVGFHPYGQSLDTPPISAGEAHSNTILRVKEFENKLNSLGWTTAGFDITEDGITQKYPEQWDRYNYFWDTARVLEDSYARVRRYHAYSWYLPDEQNWPADQRWSIAYADPTNWRPAVAGYARGISE
jgi:hypothetical protein